MKNILEKSNQTVKNKMKNIERNYQRVIIKGKKTNNLNKLQKKLQ